MKKFILSAAFLPFAVTAGVNKVPKPFMEPVQVRSGKWPISLESYGSTYGLIFRDQGVMNEEVLDTIEFKNVEQLRYLDKALVALKKGNNGDEAKFGNYSVKRADKKYEGVWYILRMKWGSTDFRQPEADIMSKAIRGL